MNNTTMNKSSVSERINTDPIFILNEKNTLVSKEFLNKLFRKYKLNHSVVNLNTFIIATTHTSYSTLSYSSTDNGTQEGYHKVREISMNKISHPTNAIPLQRESYERLEFLGDSIIHAVLAEYIFSRFYDQQEGFMTKLRTKLENSDTLAKFSQVLGLDKYILLSRYIEETNGRYNNVHILEDVFEAFIGSLFLDGDDRGKNFEMCRTIIIQLIETEIDISELLFNENNYKDMLLQYAHTRKWPDPIYGTQRVSGTENKIYEMYVKIKGNIEGVGRGNSKKKGEQLAAAEALKNFKVLHDDSDSSDDECEYTCDAD
jgi:dsRNA-specific ribonuclease